MSMHHNAQLEIIFLLNGTDAESNLIESFREEKIMNGDKLAGAITQIAENRFHIEYSAAGYYEGREIEQYLQALAKSMSKSVFTLKGEISNEGSGGDFIDYVAADYFHGSLRYNYLSGYAVLENQGKRPSQKMQESFCYWTEIDERNLVIPDGVKVIGEYAIQGPGAPRFLSLRSISIPETVVIIEHDAFTGLTGLKSVILPDSVKEIHKNAFKGCGLEEIKLSNSLEIIGAYAFEKCESLTSVTIPSSVIKIEAGAFSNCTNLKTVQINNPNTIIPDSAFSNCPSLNSSSIHIGI